MNPMRLRMFLTLFLVSPALGQQLAQTTLKLEIPSDFQVHQRTSRSGGRIIVAGTLDPKPSVPATLEVRLQGGDASPDWQRLATLRPGQTRFHAELMAPSGGWYALEARTRHENLTTAQTSIPHVGVGEVFVVSGQSNSANHGAEKQQSQTLRVATFYNGAWRIAHDPQPGASGRTGSFIPSFGDALVERFNVPIGIVATAVGATSVREWLPAGTQFPNPPTLTGNVSQLADGTWVSKGTLFDRLVLRMKEMGGNGFRAVLWHQGESDANQSDQTRTLTGPLYRQFLTQLIRDSSRELGWEPPWFVALASYHTPEDPGSPEIRTAQRALWESGVALEGPDSDAMTGDLRDNDGKGVHFSSKGLREHGVRWAEKVSPWLERQFAATAATADSGASARRITPPGTINMTIAGRPAFLYLPVPAKRASPQPWIFYAPTLPPYPDQAERWMHEQFLEAGIAVAGIDVGEAYGSPASHRVFDALYQELTERRGFAAKPCLLGRSRGGLWISSWAIAHPQRIAGIAGIYPVFDFRTYPGVAKAANAYGLKPEELETRTSDFNPIERTEVLARAGVPATLIHGDIDQVVPIRENSAEFVRRYTTAGAGSLVRLIEIKDQGHNMFEGFFHSQELVDFAIARARHGATPTR